MQVRAIPLGLDAALMTSTTEVDGPSGGKMIHVTYQVGEVWVRRAGEWKCRYSQGTPVTSSRPSATEELDYAQFTGYESRQVAATLG